MSSRSKSQSLNALPPCTVLRDYVIQSELGSGGFSIVYLARHHLNPDWLYAIKEFLPGELAVRDRDGATVHPVNTEAEEAFDDGLRRFRDEAKQLRRFRNEPYIVSCLNYFEQNGTAYLVMDHDDGLPLLELLRRREEAGQPFTERDLLAVLEPLLEGLTAVHRAGVIHRDIKPGNIFVRRQDDITGRPAHPVLIDFGAAKQNYLARHSRSRAPYTPGYAAYEQVSSEGDIGPWTDVYAVGALMWRIVAGGCPGDHRLLVVDGADGADGDELWSPTPRAAEKRAYALHRGRPDPMVSAEALGAGRFSPALLQAIDRCLALYPEDRVQSCEELRKLLDVRAEAPPASRVYVMEPSDDTCDGEAVSDSGSERSIDLVGSPREEPSQKPLPNEADVWPQRSTSFWLAAAAGICALAYAALLGVGVREWLGGKLDDEVASPLPSNSSDPSPVSGTGPSSPASRVATLDEIFRTLDSSEASSLRPSLSVPPLVTPPAMLTPGRRFRDVLHSGGEGPLMVEVPPGSFTMGTPENEERLSSMEGPQHMVTISRPFAVGVYEVTFAEWDACGAGGGCGGYRPDDAGWGRGDRPAINVSWEDAQAYLSWLSTQSGAAYRLLSESEWEYVARAGTMTRFHFGNDPSRLCSWANAADLTARQTYSNWNNVADCEDGYVHTAPVGSFDVNALGLHDVHGNVWEWVQDCSNDNYQGAPSDGRAWQRGECSRRMLRGGSWFANPPFLRSAERISEPTGTRYISYGFRVARTLTP